MATAFAKTDFGAPPLALLLGEVRVFGDWVRGFRENGALARAHVGDGRPVMVLPGFMVSDERTALLRRSLKAAGYRALGWKMGRNLGVTADTLKRIDTRVDDIIARCGEPVTLIGWSLGGLMAREYAKFAPEKVAKVITMGSPFSGDIRANNAWRLYQWVTKHAVDAPPIEARLAEKPPVQTIALWSKSDGIVAAASARGHDGERDLAIEVPCGHMSFACAPEAVDVILKAIAHEA